MSDKAVTFDEARAELAREIAVRQGVYRSWVASGRMRPEVADRQIARMRAALHLLDELHDARNEVPQALFRLRTEAGLP